MPDKILEELNEEFMRKARANRLGSSQVSTPIQTPSPQMSEDEFWSYPDWYDTSVNDRNESTMLNAVGVGLWSLVDTGLFGVPGALVKEEEFLDFEDPLAKWTGAIGGFAGFVAGAPIKVGAKIAQKALPVLGKGALKKIEKESVESVVKGMKQSAKEGGLSRQATREVTTGYRSLVRQAQVDPRLKGLQFEQKTRKYLAQYADDAVQAGTMTEAQAASLQKMFKDNIFNRPIQDFMGLMQARGMSITNPRLAKVIGHTINDTVMFGAIDTIFEGVTMIEDGDYDLTAPLWGATTGVLFGQVAWLKPTGKAASFKKDFMTGLKATFSKRAFGNLDREQLRSRAKFLGEQLKRNGDSTHVSLSYGGKKPQNINLNSDSLWDDMKDIYGDQAEKALESLLEKQRTIFGKKMMRWSTSEEAASLKENWARMGIGGLVFNAHSIYESYAHDVDPDINDVLSSFLIGAYVQRRSNPAKFDLNVKGDINRLRSNLQIMGMDPHQMAAIPTFDFRKSRFESIFNDSKFDSVLELARELEIGGDIDTVSKTLTEGEQSASLKPNLLFDMLLPQLRNHFPHLKTMDQISSADAKAIADAVIKIDSRFGDEKGRTKAVEETFLRTQENFENSFKDLIESVKNGDAENALNISMERNKDGVNVLTTPKNIRISEEIKQKAKNGELLDDSGLPLLGVDSEGKPIKGDEALDLLYNKIDGFQTSLLASDQLGKSVIDSNPRTSTKTIESESLLTDIYQKVSRFEKNVESKFVDNTIMSEGFSISDSYHDYANILVHNTSIRVGKSIIDTFSRKDDKLVGLMENSGIMHSPDVIGRIFIVDDVSKIDIKEKDGESVDADQVSKDKRFLSRVHAMQAASNIGGQYDIFKIPDTNEGRLSVTHEAIQQLRKELMSRGINLDTMPNYLQSRIVGQAVNERIKDTNLNISQAESLFNLVETDRATFGVESQGKSTGFTVKLVDESGIKGHPDSRMLQFATDYNQIIKKIIKDGNGLVVLEKDKILVTDMLEMRLLHSSVSDVNLNSSQSSRGILADFMTQLGASKKGYNAFVDQLRSFQNTDSKNASIILKWLTKSGVIKSMEDSTKIDYDLKKFNKSLRDDLSEYMNSHGVDAQYVERIYKEAEQKGRDNLLEDSAERASEKPLSLQDWVKRYRIDGENYSKESSEAIKLFFDEVIYSDKPNKILDVDILNKLLDRIHVERKDNQWKPYKELSQQEKDFVKPDIIADTIKLLGSQRAQVKIDVIKWENGNVVKEAETVQYSRLHQKMNDLELPYFIIDGRHSVEMMSDDGRYIIQRQVNVFNDSQVVSKSDRDLIKDIRKDFETFINQSRDLFKAGSPDYRDLVGTNGEMGLKIIEIAPNMDPIAIATKDLVRLNEPFREFVNNYKDREGLNKLARDQFKEIDDKIEKNESLTENEYRYMLKHVMMKEMLTGSDGDRLFIQWLNGDNSQKLMNRIKLFNTKKYVRHNKDFVLDAADVYSDNKEVSNAIKRIARNDGFGVAIWNDEGYAKIRDEVARVLKDNNLNKNYLDNVIGDAHDKVSGFDSIGFVSKQQLMYMHAISGNDPYSFNPIKPVITSGGDNSPLLLGKTLFIYSPELNGFFNKNKKIDILLAKTGAKVYNPVGEQVDTSIINVEWNDLNKQRSAPLRKISIESLGIMPNKNPQFMEAKLSQADANYMNNEESGRMFESEFSKKLEINLSSVSELMQDPIALKEWVVGQLGDQGMIADIQAGESSASTLNNIVAFSKHSRDANPRSYSDRIVENKLYQIYMDSVINGQRSSTNQYNKEDSHRYGGNSIMIPGAMFGLKPTLVNKEGVKDMMGEVMLPHYAQDLTIKELSEQGYEMRFGRKGEENLKGEQVFGKEHWDILMGKDSQHPVALGEIVDALDFLVKQGEIPEGTFVQAMIRRNPRTRPNDFALMSLKGFLKEQYGNSIAVNSLDVANVMEGDYDFDKADFFFSHRENMWDHVKRSSEFFVQGVDPTNLMSDMPLHAGMTPKQHNDTIHEMSSTANAFKAGIGLVQKVPRALSFLNNIGTEGIGKASIDSFNEQRPNQKFNKPKILVETNIKGVDSKIVLDYDNLDFYLRSALETQYIIDGDSKLNPEISQDLRSWRSDFIFPTIENSIVPGNVTKKVGFVNDMQQSGHSNNKRVRIFRKMVRTKDGWDEVNLTNLDKNIINQMLYEYTNFLGITRDSVYENTGAQKKTEYIDAFNGSDRFMRFNQDINNSIYYQLRNRDNGKGKRWRNDQEFIDYFGQVKDSYDKKGVEIEFDKPTSKILHPDTEINAGNIANGSRGAPIDRIMMKFRAEDPFNTSKTQTVGNQINAIVDEWYNELLGGGSSIDVADVDVINEKMISRADKLTRGVMNASATINRKVNLIKNLKKKIYMLYNRKMPFAAKKKAMDNLNTLIKKVESELSDSNLLSKSYLQSRKSKDLPSIEYKVADEKNMIDGAIYYSTMDAVKNIVPFDWKLNKTAQKDLQFIKDIRRLFYGNRTTKKDFIKHGDKSLLDSDQLELLNNFPDMSTFYQIESELMAKGFEKHGPVFLYQFMQPTQNRSAVGVFNNRPVSIPYEAKGTFSPSSRYRRGMRFLTSLAYGTLPSDAETMRMAKEQLSIVQFVEAQNERFFNKRIDRKGLISENLQEGLDVSSLNKDTQTILYNNMRLPNFNADFQRLFDGFNSIKWTRDNKKIASGAGLTNDHLLDFYASVMKLAGKEKEYDSYLNSMNDLNAQLIGNEFISEIDYFSQRAGMDSEVRKIAKDVFVDGIFKTELNKGNRIAKDILNNPVYALMGGAHYFKGVSLEKRNYDFDRLKQLKELSDNLNQMKDGINPDSHVYLEKFKEAGKCFR